MRNTTGEVIKHEKLGYGEWVVIETNMSGGGKAMFNDYYDDAHTLYLRPICNGVIDNSGKPKHFYQETNSYISEVVLPYIVPSYKVDVVTTVRRFANVVDGAQTRMPRVVVEAVDVEASEND
jgi:hypothetical protein